MTTEHPQPSRAAGLARLAAFLPRAGLAYAAHRNRDLAGHPHVSGLSPWLRHRLLTEAEVIAAVRAAHPQGADKFLAEVLWRSYWKGWLERRPAVWADYQRDLGAALNRIGTESGLRRAWEDACSGQTGIEGFDHWAKELVATGYLHNHARMWFASIWVFTLRLPWQLGADFFLRHLIDGDPASNTLSWRWVAGLHTAGKTYLATADNIARNTDGRFRPTGLAATAEAPAAPLHPPLGPTPAGDTWSPTERSLLLVTDDDLSPEFLLEAGLTPAAVAVLSDPVGRSPLHIAPAVQAWTNAALSDALVRVGVPDAPRFGPANLAALADHAATARVSQIVIPYASVGPVASLIAALRPMAATRGIALTTVLRDHDRLTWPHATHGFFRFREAVN